MLKILFIVLSFSSFPLWAESLISYIQTANGNDGFIRLTNGRIVFTNQDQDLSYLENGTKVKLDIDINNQMKSIDILEAMKKVELPFKSFNTPSPAPEFTPSVLPDYDSAIELFNRLNPNYKRVSECTDRAHIWSYDEFKNHGIKSQKAFIFFTASYINRHKFKWWFHVAPMVQVNENGLIQPRIMDFRYTDRPLLIKEWSDLLVYSKRDCKLTTKFSEYDVNPQTEDCYMIIESMFYRLPSDIYNQELKNRYRSSFSDSEITFSRKLAFEQMTNRGAL